MKRILTMSLIGLMALIGGMTQAQERYIKIYSGGQEVYSVPTTGSNSLRLVDGNATFNHNGTTTTFALSNIDSMVFAKVYDSDPDTNDSDTIAVDTVGAIRITWNGTLVDIVNPFASLGVNIGTDGGNVSVTSTIDSAYIRYILSGSSNNGSLSITSDKQVLVQLDNLSLTSTSGPAILMASDRRMALDLVGTNSLADNSSNSGKGALQAAGKLSFQGQGTLEVTGNAKHGIQSSGRCTKYSGNIVIVSAVKDGMNIDDFIQYDGQTVVMSAGGDGIDGDQGFIGLYGGMVQVNGTVGNGICADGNITLGGADVTVDCPTDAAKCIKTKADMLVSAGTISLSNHGDYVIDTAADGSIDLSYPTGIKVGGNFAMVGGSISHSAPSTVKAVRSISCDGNVNLAGGSILINNVSSCNKFLVSGSTYQSYTSAGIKSNGNITVADGANLDITCNGRGISSDHNYTQTGGTVVIANAGAGFTLVGSGTSCTDGFAPACLKADSNIVITGGTFNGTSTGKGGRGIVGDGTMTIGTLGAEDSLISIYVTTSGTPVNTTSGGGWPGPGGGGESDNWKGLPKGVKIEGNITINSGHLQSYCSQTSGSTTGEAIETKDSLFINGGTVEANAYDDAINAGSFIRITGGQVWAYARGNDGLDCNGNRIEISGGTVICRGSEVAIDDNGDHGGKLYITGGTIILVGGNMGTTEATPQVTGQKAVKISSNNVSTILTNGIAVKNETSGNVVVTFKWPNNNGNGFESYVPSPLTNGPKPPGGNSGIYISTPDIQSGNTYKYYTSPTISGGTSWHGLYDGATVTTSGNGTSLTVQ